MTTDCRVTACAPDATDRDEWDDLADRTPIPAGLSQRFDSSQVDATEGLRSSFLCVRNPEGRLVGGIRITVERRFPLRHFELTGGPLFLPGYEDDVRSLVARTLRDMVLVVDSGFLRPSPGHSWHLEDFGLHRSRDPLETIIVDLSPSEEELWHNVDHSVRQGIRKAREHGLTVREVTAQDELEGIYPLIERFGREKDFATISKSHFLATHRYFHSAGRSLVLVCEAGSVPVGVATVELANQRASLLFVASDPEFAKVQMNSLLDWEAIRAGKGRGATSFDFVGLPPAGSGLAGLRRFKMKWGGSIVEGEEYLEGELFRFATKTVRRWPNLFRPVVMQRGPFRLGIR